MEFSEFLQPFLGALQAAVSVLLTIFFGVVAAQTNLLSTGAAKEVSTLCVRLFLPALLVTKLGAELEAGTALRYVPILIWAIVYNLSSLLLGVLATRTFKLPPWVTPALAFNNTTSMPLLLIQSLESTGILQSILLEGDSASAAIDRAQSYFLVNAMVNNSLTFALGPRLLRPHDEDAPDNGDDKDEDDQDQDEVERGEQAGASDPNLIDEETSLLPSHLVRKTNSAERSASREGHAYWKRLPPPVQGALDIAYSFLNAPLLGAVLGAIIGLTPPLHKLFFNESNEGGYLNAWLTSAIKNVGDLFASLQIIVVGVKLSMSLRKMKRGEESGEVPWTCLSFITLVRFFLWPLISIPLVWALATKTGILGDDPMLYFAMMLMPTGPPAMILVALADVNGSSEIEKMAIAKFLTLSYALTPLICFAVVGSLKATEVTI